MKYFVVDAFAERVFGGNPAGVCVLESALNEQTMQSIAKENNLSETAFVYKEDDHYCLRLVEKLTCVVMPQWQQHTS